MKNKKLMGIVVAILIIPIAFVAFNARKKGEQGKDSGQKTVGVLQYVSHPALDSIYKGIKKGLAEEGFKEGKNLTIVFKNAQADQSKLKPMSEELLSENPAAVIGIATPSAQALANQTKDVPVVLGAITDPVAAGLVKNRKKPGGNVTGVSDQSPVAAQLELAKKLLPKAKTFGILYSSSEDNSKSQVADAKKAAKENGFSVKEYAVPSTSELSTTVGVMVSEVDFIYIPNDNQIANAMQTVVKLADEKKIPIIPVADTMVKEGGLATVGIDQFKLGLETGKMTAEILKGKKPANMPIFTFKTGDMVINTKQAQKLGIEIPEEVLKKAKKVE